MSDLNLGFGKILRVRLLRADRKRLHIVRPTVQTVSALRVRAEKAQDLLERRRLQRLAKEDTVLLDKEISSLGYVVQDEPDCDDGRYSYWRKK